MSAGLPTLEAMRATRERLGDRIVTTPARLWQDDPLARIVGAAASSR
jgi:threonine dehydratase